MKSVEQLPCCERVGGDLGEREELVALNRATVILPWVSTGCSRAKMSLPTLSSFMNRFRNLSTSSRSTVGVSLRSTTNKQYDCTIGARDYVVQERGLVFPSRLEQRSVVWFRHDGSRGSERVNVQVEFELDLL